MWVEIVRLLNVQKLIIYFAASWLTFNTIAAFCLMWSKNYYLNATLIIIITSTSACSTNICAIVSDLFPTHLKYSCKNIIQKTVDYYFCLSFRVMSLSLMITFTRLGGIIGSNITAAMIYGLCSTLYGLNFILLSSATIVLYFILRKCELAKQRSQFWFKKMFFLLSPNFLSNQSLF